MKKVSHNVLALEGLLLVWALKDIVLSAHGDLFESMMAMLLYLCLKLVYYIFVDRPLGKYVIGGILVYIGLASYFVYPPLAYFIVLNLCQAIILFRQGYLRLALLGLAGVFYLDLAKDTYLMVSMCVFFLVYQGLHQELKHMKSIEARDLKAQALHQLQLEHINARLYEASRDHTLRLEERNTIAQKLHDEMGHVLSGSTLQLEAALLVLDKDQEKSRAMVAKVISNLREGSEEIRLILKAIKPEGVSMNIQKLKTLIASVKDQSGIEVNLFYSNDISQLGLKQWHVVLMNVKEAMTNMMKYAKATECDVRFESLNTMIKVTIQDNGQGCRVLKKGMGLQGMSERMVALKGQLIVDGHQGFSLVMLMPIEKGD